MSKLKQQREKKVDSRPRKGPSIPPQQTLSPLRRWSFRAAAVLVPLVLLGLLELCLRLVGVGYSPDFFLSKQLNGQRVWVENDKFGLRFFPPELARSPSPLVMAAEKPKDTCRIFILGESAALGDPEPAFGFGRYLQVLLQDRFPGTHFEVICTAMTAINSHTILPIARECARHQGDIWVVYMGNNEFVGPFGPSTVFGPQVPPLSVIRLQLALKATRLGQLVSNFAAKPSRQKNWGGMQMFLDHQIGPGDSRRKKVYDYFQQNLQDILAAARGSGAKVVLSTVAVNLKDCAPFASQHPANLSASQKDAWQNLYDAAVHQQSAGHYESAISNYQAAAQTDAAYAELQFRWGQCLLAVTNSTEASRHFALARDDDALPFRTDERQNQILAETSKNYASEGVRLVDSANLLAEASANHIVGNESLYEHVHLNFEGNYRLARAIAETAAGMLPATATNRANAGWASLDECSRQLALTDWDRRRIYENLAHRFAEPPFINQMDHASQLDSVRRTITELRSKQTAAALEQARAVYQEATQAMPQDLYVQANFAKLEEDAGDLASAAIHWRAVRDQIPFTPGPHYYLGKVLGSAGKTEQALNELDQALAIRPDLAEALQEKGRLLVKDKKPEEGLRVLDQAVKMQPRNARLCVDRAEALAQLGRRAEALDQLQVAVTLQPGYWEARYLLGVEFTFKGAIRDAAEQFLESVRLNPNYAPGHLNLGIALAKLDKLDQARAQFEETLRLDPKNQKAAQYLEALKSAQKPKR